MRYGILPHLNSHDFFIWGFLKVIVHKSDPHIIQEIKKEILPAVISITECILAGIVQNFQRRLQMILDAGGAHTEIFFT
jgi:hypothetical protein